MAGMDEALIQRDSNRCAANIQQSHRAYKSATHTHKHICTHSQVATWKKYSALMDSQPKQTLRKCAWEMLKWKSFDNCVSDEKCQAIIPLFDARRKWLRNKLSTRLKDSHSQFCYFRRKKFCHRKQVVTDRSEMTTMLLLVAMVWNSLKQSENPTKSFCALSDREKSWLPACVCVSVCANVSICVALFTRPNSIVDMCHSILIFE